MNEPAIGVALILFGIGLWVVAGFCSLNARQRDVTEDELDAFLLAQQAQAERDLERLAAFEELQRSPFPPMSKPAAKGFGRDRTIGMDQVSRECRQRWVTPDEGRTH